jgi:hypothetical protein
VVKYAYWAFLMLISGVCSGLILLFTFVVFFRFHLGVGRLGAL